MSRQPGAHILVVDDEPAIARAIRTNLTRHGFHVEVVESAAQALDRYATDHPDLLLLDLGLPDGDGLAIIREIRTHSNTPIIVLSVRSAEREKVEAFSLGADDYLTKPFGVDELLARVRVALRHAVRPSRGTEAVFRDGDLEVDVEQRRVKVGDLEVHLSPTEYALLKVFITNPNKLLTDRMLLRQVWGPEYGDEAHYLHVYVARLRKKIEVDPQNPRCLVTEPGVGYRLIAEER